MNHSQNSYLKTRIAGFILLLFGFSNLAAQCPTITSFDAQNLVCSQDEVSISISVDAQGVQLDVILEQDNFNGTWSTVESRIISNPAGVQTEVFNLTASSIDNCSNYRVALELNDGIDPNCLIFSDEFTVAVHSGGVLPCNGVINMSLDASCSLDLDIDNFIEGDIASCGPTISQNTYLNAFYSVSFEAPDGSSIANGSDLGDYAGMCLDFIVTDNCSGNRCWGTACIEDKQTPELVCDCPIGGDVGTGEYSDDCTIKCHDVDNIQDNIEDVLGCDVLRLPLLGDNCLTNQELEDNLVYVDEIINQNKCDYLFRRSYTLYETRLNEFTGNYENIEVASCTYEYLVEAYDALDTVGLVDIADLGNFSNQERRDNIFLPLSYVELTCDVDFTPEAIVEAFDNPLTNDVQSTTQVEENNEGIPYGYPFYYAVGNACNLYAQRIENRICNINLSYTDQVTPVCDEACKGNNKVLRNWVILDWCESEIVRWPQLIKVVDTEGPAIDVQPSLTVSVDPWTCTANFDLPIPNLLHDNCDGPATYEVQALDPLVTITGNAQTGYSAAGVQKSMNGSTTTFYYYGVDCCGNISGPILLEVLALDRTPPVAVTLENYVVNLSSIGFDSSAIAKVFATDLDNGSYDLCSGVHLEVRRSIDNCDYPDNLTYNNNGDPDDSDNDTDDGLSVKFCCGDLTDVEDGVEYGIVEVIIRVWDDGNMDGVFGNEGDNYNETWAEIRVENKVPPPPVCPPNVVIPCSWDAYDLDKTGVPQVFVTCGTSDIEWEHGVNITTVPALKRAIDAPELNPIVGDVVQPYNPSCRTGALRREFGGCTQWIILQEIEPGFNDLSIVFPEDKTVDCLDTEKDEPTFDSHQCDLVGYTVESDTFNLEEGACMRVQNLYTIINWCRFDPEDSDLDDITDGLEDGVIPGMWQSTQIVDLVDNQDPSFEMLTDTCIGIYNDICETEQATLSFVGYDDGICPSPWIKWEIILDLWGDLTPDYTFSSFILSNDPFYIEPTARGEQLDIILPEGISSSKSKHKLFVNVSDGCDNVTTQIVEFEIVDKKAPTPYCLNLSTALMQNGQVELWACDFDAGSFDNCTDTEDLRFTFTSIPPNLDPEYDPNLQCSARVFDVEALDSTDVDGIIELPIYVWDECDNSDFCVVNLRLVDNFNGPRASIEGNVTTEEGARVSGVQIALNSDTPGFNNNDSSDHEGGYAFMDNPMYLNYEISGSKNEGHLNGVSTLDLVLIQKHILGIQEFTSGYKRIAADINNDESVSAIDLIELRKLILGIYKEFPSNKSWRFVPTAFDIDHDNPWPFSESILISSLESDLSSENYVGVKIGDVNGSVNTFNSENEIKNRSEGDLIFNVKNLSLKKGESKVIDFYSYNYDAIVAFQFGMLLKDLEVVQMIPGAIAITEDHYAVFDEILTCSWNSLINSKYDESTILFSIEVKAREDINQLSNRIGLNNMITKTEAYSNNDALMGIGIEFRSKEAVNNEVILLQNKPNPFTDYTVIEFNLPKKQQAKISIYNSNGQILYHIESTFKKGMNAVELTKDLLGQYGLLYYELETVDFKETKKMILVR